MPASKPQFPYLFHTYVEGMEAGKRCAAMVFHTFHTFHTCFSCAHVGGRAHTRVHVRVHPRTGINLGMEGMEGMEEGHTARLLGFHTSAIRLEGMEPTGENQWN
ncbi:MAG: hypothetical protein H6R14_787 [Proteobacteria bacterium]|nr:hypothetical protein [Pseudomonadota bacterium]